MQAPLRVETPQERRERLERGPAAQRAPKRKRGDGDERSLHHPDDAERARERDVRVQRERAPRDQEREPLERVAELCFAVRFATARIGVAGSARGKGTRRESETSREDPIPGERVVGTTRKQARMDVFRTRRRASEAAADDVTGRTSTSSSMIAV